MLTIKFNTGDLFPSDDILADAAGRGVENLIIQHLRNRNGTRPSNKYGLPKSNYYADAAKDVETTVSGKTAFVTIPKEGVALHYYGGTVLPKKKALAVPIDPLVATIWPSEYEGQGHKLFKTPAGALGDAETGRILWVLLSKVTIKPDPTVLPDDNAMLAAAETAITEALS